MAIVTSYVAGEAYGLLGPQLAATLISEHTRRECIVVAVTRDDDKASLAKALAGYFGNERPVVGFSGLSGREELFEFARELTRAEWFTLLAGPQADVDFRGEVDCHNFPHRFQGLSRHFNCALHGPAEQSFPLLDAADVRPKADVAGLLRLGAGGAVLQNSGSSWNEAYLAGVRWDNLYRLKQSELAPHRIGSGQVLQQIGCPHAAVSRRVAIDYPARLHKPGAARVGVRLSGCSFCDVAVDKGFQGRLGIETVIRQIRSLPTGTDGRKLPFELINESPLPGLAQLLTEAAANRLELSRINLIMRADWLLKGADDLRKALRLARECHVRIVLASVGFESFDDTILRNLNKGLDVATIVKAVSLMRCLKEEFPDVWGYSRAEGANHGFIHPTPWDSAETAANIQSVISRYDLAPDILPDHSTPLIIHHASGLADWIRAIEMEEGCRFPRCGTIVGWWEMEPLQGGKMLL